MTGSVKIKIEIFSRRKKMKKNLKALTVLAAMIFSTGFIGCKKTDKDASKVTEAKNESVEKKLKVVASTSWTAAFADLAGIDDVEIIAPASLRHPPEYEITVSDIQKIKDCDIFIFAGFERMMQTIGDTIENVKMVKITCDNSIATVTSSAMTIADGIGTQTLCESRVLEYVNKIYEGKNALKEKGLEGAKVLCNSNQRFLANELGLEIVGTFGPNPVTSEQIKFASENKVDFIIDNVHNPVGQPLAEVSPDAKYIVWRNFPEKVERKALINVVSENMNKLINQ